MLHIELMISVASGVDRPSMPAMSSNKSKATSVKQLSVKSNPCLSRMNAISLVCSSGVRLSTGHLWLMR